MFESQLFLLLLQHYRVDHEISGQKTLTHSCLSSLLKGSWGQKEPPILVYQSTKIYFQLDILLINDLTT